MRHPTVLSEVAEVPRPAALVASISATLPWIGWAANAGKDMAAPKASMRPSSTIVFFCMIILPLIW